MSLLNSIKYDMKFGFRHNFYGAYMIVAVVYILALRMIPQGSRENIGMLILFSDPSALGAFFIGAIIMLEKSQNTLQGVLITPMSIKKYIWTKVLSLLMISVGSSVVIAIFGIGGDINYILIVISVGLTAIFFTLVGFVIALYSKSLNSYFINSMVIVPFMIPVLGYLNIYSNEMFKILPSYWSLELLKASMYKMDVIYIILAILILVLWCIIAFIVVEKVFNYKVILKVGED